MDQPLYPLGRINRTHGYNGTVVLVSDRVLDDDLENLEELFVAIDGLQVPFPVEELSLRTDSSASVKLTFVDSLDEAAALIGCEVYTAAVPREQEAEAGLEQWIGFAVHDTGHGNIGIVQEIENYSGNIVMRVVNGDRETLISLYPKLITCIDNRLKTLHIAAPDGYFD